ncbi:MAG: DUF1772 domain-containing protein [Burkholderiales bacterium]
MIEKLLFLLTLLCVLGSGLIAGVFFAFSSFVMKALARRPPDEGMAAMQSINVAVLNPWFLGAFLGTAMLCVAVLIASLLRWTMPGSALHLTGSVLYLVGTFGVTMKFNVPRNEALAVALPTDLEAERLWTNYVADWTFWNHVRTAAAIGATVMFGVALGY